MKKLTVGASLLIVLSLMFCLTSLAITVDPYYSYYSSTHGYYDNTYVGLDFYQDLNGAYHAAYIFEDDGLGLRANCYGYASRLYYVLNNFGVENTFSCFGGNTFNRYLQQPGEFCNKTLGVVLKTVNNQTYETVYNYSDLIRFYSRIFSDSNLSNADRMKMIYDLVTADMMTLGSSVSEYAGSTIPDASTFSNKRLIALVVSETDFHFYMQHEDNT